MNLRRKLKCTIRAFRRKHDLRREDQQTLLWRSGEAQKMQKGCDRKSIQGERGSGVVSPAEETRSHWGEKEFHMLKNLMQASMLRQTLTGPFQMILKILDLNISKINEKLLKGGAWVDNVFTMSMPVLKDNEIFPGTKYFIYWLIWLEPIFWFAGQREHHPLRNSKESVFHKILEESLRVGCQRTVWWTWTSQGLWGGAVLSQR